MDAGAAIIITVITAATPLVFAALGELITERAGVLNLGVEGMMLVGAVCAFVAGTASGSHTVALLAGAGAGMVLALLFAFLTLHCLTNQVATGLALTIFGTGVSSLLGREFVGTPIERLPRLEIAGLSDLPLLGPVVFGHDAMVYGSFLAIAVTSWFLTRTRTGLALRAIGENHTAAHMLGYRVRLWRYAAVLFGGAMGGIGGAYLSLAYTPMWAEDMTAGRGWICLALVVFATWRPGRLLLGAYLFGGVTIFQLHAQAWGLDIASQFLSMLPYLATIAVLVLISSNVALVRQNAPACLGRVFHPDT